MDTTTGAQYTTTVDNGIIRENTAAVNGGHIANNSATYSGNNGNTTADLGDSQNRGVGGGVYLAAGTSVESNFTMTGEKSAGIYDNTAKFAADDVFASKSATVLSLPNVENMDISGGTRESPTNLFPDFQNVMPGDRLTQQIEIKSTAAGSRAKVYLRSKGAQKDSEALLSQMYLTVTQAGKGRRFEAPADETAQLTDWVYLGTLRFGGKATLELQLEVDPEMGNAFMQKAGYIDWEFKVEEYPVTDLPETGDVFDLMLWVSVMVISLSGILLILFRKKNRSRTK